MNSWSSTSTIFVNKHLISTQQLKQQPGMKKHMPPAIVDVILLTYNRPHLFPGALDSIQRQSFKDYRVFVIDNGSTPPITLPKHILDDPRFELVRFDENAHGQYNVLKLIGSLQAKYTAILFDDDRWTDKKLEKQISFLENHPETAACFTHASFIGDDGSTLEIPPEQNVFFAKNRSRGEWAHRFFHQGNCLCQPSVVIRTETSTEIFLPAPYFKLHDFSAWIKLLGHGEIHVIEEPLTLYRWFSNGSNESSISTPAAANQLFYENSKALQLFRSLPVNLLRATFKLPDDATEEHINQAMFDAAIQCNDEAHYRFAAELSEAMFKHHYENNDVISSSRWRKQFEIASSKNPGKYTSNASRSQTGNNEDYALWLSRRTFISEDIGVIERLMESVADKAPNFHIFIRLNRDAESLLADTIDSLSSQFYPNWHLDIISPLNPPDGLDTIPCITWQTIKETGQEKSTIDALVNLKGPDWCLELPAGAKLDPLYLWRMVEKAQNTASCAGIFVDDDIFDSGKNRQSPRFKPGVNPAALQSSDLAGPICVRHDAWLATGGASQRNGSPWFSQLLRITEKFGWNSIKHIPDILISYADIFPSHTESCLLASIENAQNRGTKSEIIPVSGQSWCMRFPLDTIPRVSIAILSQGHLDLLKRCFGSIIEITDYADFEINIVLTESDTDPELAAWLEDLPNTTSRPVRTTLRPIPGNHASRCNAAVHDSLHDLVLLIREESVVIQEKWLEELVRTCQQPDVAAASPCLIASGTNRYENAGDVLGLNGIVGSPYRDNAELGERGYLDCLKVNRDVSALPGICLLVRKSAYLAAGGMDEIDLGDHLADSDLCQKLRMQGHRLIYQPMASVACDTDAMRDVDSDITRQARLALAKAHATKTFVARLSPEVAIDPFWNPNLSLSTSLPSPETDFRAQWQYLPSPVPRILAHALPNGQGVFRITSPLRALRKANMAAECLWPQSGSRIPGTVEIQRLAPETVIVQHYLYDAQLAGLEAWHASPSRPFIVYALDDLLTEMDENNPFRTHIPTNSRARLKYALERSDRLVTSTEFLAETYRHFITDIRVVPNRLEKNTWLPLETLKRTGNKPRIGWAGGSTHQGDLLLLREIIEMTRGEADWIFFGMCPAEIRPLLAEYHELVPFSQYPAQLAALNLDIAVAPLALTPFNRGKSNLRLLEYGILGIPVVCTDIDPYRNSPACLVPNTPQAWIEAIRARIHDANAREQEGAAMRYWVCQNYLLEEHLENWLAAHTRPQS